MGQQSSTDRQRSRRASSRALAIVTLVVIGSGCTAGMNLFGWGVNTSSQIGDGTAANRTAPVRVGTEATWTEVAAGDNHSCGVKANATLWCWGSNSAGQIGDGSGANRTAPVQVGVDTDWRSVSVGSSHSCAVKKTGALWCWGSNSSGQVGDGTLTVRTTPVAVGADLDWSLLAAGGQHTCATRTSGTLWCWGENTTGQVGDGTGVDRSAPVPVGTDTNWTQVAAGADATCGIAGGSLRCWGRNQAGQVGDGGTADRTAPVAVGASSWLAVDVAATHGCGVQSNGTMWCWGTNALGQMGTGATSSTPTGPTQVGSAGDWTHTATATTHSCGIRQPGTMWCWGSNQNGRLGDGTTTNRFTPQRIGPGSDWKRVVAGANHVLGLRTSAVDVDTDGDRLLDTVETGTGTYVSPTNTGTDPNQADTDGDSIRDGDEVLGTIDGLDLAALGASPLKKNILLEFDWFDSTNDCGFHTQRPTAAAIARYEQAFAAAPLTNPDGSTGVKVISDYGQGGPFTGGNLVPDADGVIAGGVSGGDFLAYKSANFAGNRNGYFHYVLMPHRYNTTSGSSGQAEILGDDLIVSLQCFQSTSNVGNTIMHELGHNLNLRHGGTTDVNDKPNYNSVMNYKYQFPGVDSNCTPPGDGVLDYSRGVRIALNENALIEADGTCGAGFPWDWDGDGTIDASSVKVDINNADGLFQTHSDADDWVNMRFTGIGDGDGARPGPVEVVTEQPVPTDFQN